MVMARDGLIPKIFCKINRISMPNIERKLKCPGIPFTPIITVLCCLVLLTSTRKITWIGFLIWLCIGLFSL